MSELVAPKMGRPPGRGPRYVWTPEVQGAFLLALRRSGSMNAAAGAVGVHFSLVRYHRDRDPEFAAEIDVAKQAHEEELLNKLREWVTTGVVTKEFRDADGKVTMVERKVSERLLLAWLRRQESGTWHDKLAVDQTVSGTVKHEVSGRIEVEHMTPEQRRLARAFLASLPAPKADGA